MTGSASVPDVSITVALPLPPILVEWGEKIAAVVRTRCRDVSGAVGGTWAILGFGLYISLDFGDVPP